MQAAFTDGEVLTGDVTDQLGLYDGGTEVNEEPALGDNQPARQQRPNTGTDENGVITRVDGTDSQGFSYPAPGEMMSLTIAAEESVVE